MQIELQPISLDTKSFGVLPVSASMGTPHWNREEFV